MPMTVLMYFPVISIYQEGEAYIASPLKLYLLILSPPVHIKLSPEGAPVTSSSPKSKGGSSVENDYQVGPARGD